MLVYLLFRVSELREPRQSPILGKKSDYFAATVSRSAFQKVWGDRITGAAPCTVVDTADRAFLLIRKMNGSCSTTISCTRSNASLRRLGSVDAALARIRRSISASHAVSGSFCCGFH